MEKLVSLRGATKKYGALTAVNDLTLDIMEGEIFAFLGPNGSGKTTTFLMMMGLTVPTSGVLEICGFDPVHNSIEIKRQVSYLPDTLGFYEDLTAGENLEYTAALSGLGRAETALRTEQLLGRVGLLGQREKKVGEFSRGMKQRLGIADVLMKKPRLVILDEPTLGLDPDGAKELLAIISELSREQKLTVLISSHQLEHVQLIGDRIAIFKQGVMKACGSMEELSGQMHAQGTRVCEVVLQTQEGFAAFAQSHEGILSAEAGHGGYVLEYKEQDWEKIVRDMVLAGFVPLGIAAKSQSLRDIYQHYFES